MGSIGSRHVAGDTLQCGPFVGSRCNFSTPYSPEMGRV